MARHCIAAVSVEGPDRAVHWALEAAAVDRAALAFREAAAHLRRLRAAVAAGAAEMTDDQLFEVLIAEADALARAGSTLDARGLLRAARASPNGPPTRTRPPAWLSPLRISVPASPPAATTSWQSSSGPSLG